MGGILLLVLLAVYFALTISLFKKAKSRRRKVIVLVVAMLIPTADHTYYRVQLELYCKNEAGFHGATTIQSSDGIYFNVDDGEFYFNKYNLDLVEWKYDSALNLYRVYRGHDMEIVKERVSDIISKYELHVSITSAPPFRYTSYQIREINSKEIISKVKNASYYGGWFSRDLLGSIAGSGPTLVANCRDENKVSPMVELMTKAILTNVNVPLEENR